MPTPLKSLTGKLLVQNDKQQLLKDINDSIYGGGQAPPAGTPTPTPTPKPSKNFLAKLLGLS